MLQPFRFLPAKGPPRRSAQATILAEWRRVDLQPLERIRERPARSAESLLPGVLKGIRIDRRQSEAEIVRVWNGIIDPQISAHAQPRGLHKGTLFVTVDNNVWLSEIVRYRRKEILDRLQHAFGKAMIQRISFSLG